MSANVDRMELKAGMPPELAEKGWRLFLKDSTAPYEAENEQLDLSTGGYPTKDQAIDAARSMEIEEEERAAIASDGAREEDAPIEIEPGRRTLPVNSIRTDGGTQPRSALDMLVVGDYKDAMLNEAEFPPVDVFFDGKDFWLADGFHRLQARKEADVEKDNPISVVDAEVRLGSKRDALMYALGANATHGLPRSREDKRRAVVMMLEDDEWSKFSDNVIADKVNVSQPFVSKLRRELTSQNVLSDQPVRVGADGVTRDTSHIGKAAEEDDRQTSFEEIAEPLVAKSEAEESKLIEQPDTEQEQSAATSTTDVDEDDEVTTPDGIVALLKRHGGMLMRMQLEEMGVSYAAIHQAIAEGAIIQPETGKFTLPDHQPQPSGNAKRDVSTGPAPKPKPSVEEILKGRQLSISFTWIPALKGQVSVSVNMGKKPTDATRLVLATDKIPRFPEEIVVAIHDQLKETRTNEYEEKKKPKVVKRAAAASKRPATKKSAKKAAKKTSPRRKK